MFADQIAYIEAMTELEPFLPIEEREELQRWYRSPLFTRDSDWPGWAKYLGPRPAPPVKASKPSVRRRLA